MYCARNIGAMLGKACINLFDGMWCLFQPLIYAGWALTAVDKCQWKWIIILVLTFIQLYCQYKQQQPTHTYTHTHTSHKRIIFFNVVIFGASRQFPIHKHQFQLSKIRNRSIRVDFVKWIDYYGWLVADSVCLNHSMRVWTNNNKYTEMSQQTVGIIYDCSKYCTQWMRIFVWKK